VVRNWEAFVRRHLLLPDLKPERERRIVRELADQLEDFYRDAIARGLSEEEADAFAVRQIRDWECFASDVRRADRANFQLRFDRWADKAQDRAHQQGGWWHMLSDVLRDAAHGLRVLRKSPGFTLVAVLTLALGIGATTAIFTLVHAVVLSPLSFNESDRLIDIGHTAPSRGTQDAGQCAAWHLTYEDENRVFTDIGMYLRRGRLSAVTGNGDPEAVRAMLVTSGVFRALRVQAALGRIFTREDDNPDAPPVVILSHGYWQSRFGGDRDVIGKTLQVDGGTREIVGVMPPVLRGLGAEPALFMLMRFRRENLFVGNIGFDSVARLRDGVTMEEAEADLTRMLPMAWEKFPGGPVASSSRPEDYSVVLQPLKDDLVGSAANILWVLMGGVGLILLIACANVANLFLVRAEGKETEMAVRTAMGASSRRIGWEYLKESLLLGLVGGVAGLALAQIGLHVLKTLGPTRLPRLEEVTLSPTVLLFALCVSIGTGLFFGVFPILRHRRKSVVDALKQGGHSGTSGSDRHRAQNSLAVTQLALALVLLVASGLMLRSFQSIWATDPGFQNPEGVLAFRVRIPPQEIQNAADMAKAHELITRRLADLPGVTSAGLGQGIPMDGSGNVNPFYVDGVTLDSDGPPPIRRHKWIGEGYFETLQIPLLVGRTFTWQDVESRFPGAILSESLAKEYFGSAQAALGQRVAARPDPPRWHEVVGVVADVRDDGMGSTPLLEVYWPQVTLAFWEGNPLDQLATWRTMGYAVRSDRVGTSGFLEEVRNVVWSVNPNLPLTGVQTLTALMEQSTARTSFTMILLAIAAGVALVLGVVGVYGVISYAVSLRSREIGMRMALGARDGDVKKMVLKQGLLLSGIGVTIGLGLAFGLTRLMSGLLFGVRAADPLTYGVVAAGLIGVALTASYLPARRAASLDPIAVLRAE
jgi:predicted permease